MEEMEEVEMSARDVEDIITKAGTRLVLILPLLLFIDNIILSFFRLYFGIQYWLDMFAVINSSR